MSGSPADIFKQSARIRHGALTGTITSNGGVLENIYGANATLNVVSGRTLIEGMEGYGSDVDVSLGTVNVTGGQLWVQDEAKLSAVNQISYMTLNSPTNKNPSLLGTGGLPSVVQDGLVLGLGPNKRPALTVTEKFQYDSGNIYLYAPNSIDPSNYAGDWKVLDFKPEDLSSEQYSEMFSNTYLMVEDAEGNIGYYEFNSDGSVNPLNEESRLLRTVVLEKGSLVLAVGEQIDIGGNTDGSGASAETIEDEVEDEIIDEIVGGEDIDSNSNQDGDATGDGGGSIDFEDGTLEDVVTEKDPWTTKELIEIVKKGLLPLNVDGAGQTLSVYNNLLADTVFERTPMRQFNQVEPEVEEVEVPQMEAAPEQEPVRGLWSKSGELDEQQADQYLAEQTATMPMVLADGQATAELMGDELLLEIDGKTYLEDDSLANQYAGRDGVRGWFRGFGGRSADSNGKSDTIFNPYTISASGGILGVDVSLSESFQLGAYANYGDINLSQHNGVGDLDGGWNADGWGGGLTADYWTQNFYVQGLLGATGFSGEQRRNIDGYGSRFDEQTATGDKSATSMVGALRLGAPFRSGSTYIEPQLTATWSGNNENRFSESADDDRLGLTYKSRNTNYLQTALGVKFAWPMKTSDTGLFTPSLKLAWIGDWNLGNEGQTIGFEFTDRTYKVGSNQEDVNGALIEAGLDYNVLKLEKTTLKGYLRGGAEVWGGNRGTNWRASGGVTFQF